MASIEIRTDLEGLVDISPFSTVADRGEVLVPPRTYLEVRSESSVAAVVEAEERRRREVKFSVIEVAPQVAQIPEWK